MTNSTIEFHIQAVWITALLPYFVLIPLLIRGVFLEGAWLGIRYYLEPQWEKIFDVDVWVEAAKQIYFSLGPGFGTLMALSSYNKFHHNCRRYVTKSKACTSRSRDSSGQARYERIIAPRLIT